jgi:hypothetical protein
MLISRRTYIKDQRQLGLGVRLVRSKQFGCAQVLEIKERRELSAIAP